MSDEAGAVAPIVGEDLLDGFGKGRALAGQACALRGSQSDSTMSSNLATLGLREVESFMRDDHPAFVAVEREYVPFGHCEYGCETEKDWDGFHFAGRAMCLVPSNFSNGSRGRVWIRRFVHLE